MTELTLPRVYSTVHRYVRDCNKALRQKSREDLIAKFPGDPGRPRSYFTVARQFDAVGLLSFRRTEAFLGSQQTQKANGLETVGENNGTRINLWLAFSGKEYCRLVFDIVYDRIRI